ncbi:MAG: TRAM domain-containing protein [Candidatus Omnitrophota bacterium]
MSDIARLEIHSLAYGARGVSRTGGKVCFVKGALPGEEVLARVTKETSNYSEAVALDVVKSSPDRIVPVCPYFGSCGGCQLQHLSYSKELYYKNEQVKELFKRIAGIELGKEFEDIAASDREYGYRSSLTLHKGKNGYGYYEEASHRVVEIEKCPVAVPVMGNDIVSLTRGEDRDEITLKADSNGKVWSSCRMGDRFFPDRYRGKDIYFSPKAFSQCNRYVSEKMAETLETWVSPRSEGAAFFDIYCGSGFFSFTVGGSFAFRIGVDENRVSIDCAKNTAKTQGIKNIKFYRQDAEKDIFELFAREKRRRNIFLLDPPRKGVKRDFLEKLRDNPDIGLLYYISCDPARMARDAKIFTTGGKWKLNRIKPFDMFPRTGHVEVLGEFTKAAEN